MAAMTMSSMRVTVKAPVAAKVASAKARSQRIPGYESETKAGTTGRRPASCAMRGRARGTSRQGRGAVWLRCLPSDVFGVSSGAASPLARVLRVADNSPALSGTLPHVWFFCTVFSTNTISCPCPVVLQVSVAAPVSALKASSRVHMRSARQGVVAMSANTDTIIESMKTLTVSAAT